MCKLMDSSMMAERREESIALSESLLLRLFFFLTITERIDFNVMRRR